MPPPSHPPFVSPRKGAETPALNNNFLGKCNTEQLAALESGSRRVLNVGLQLPGWREWSQTRACSSPRPWLILRGTRSQKVGQRGGCLLGAPLRNRFRTVLLTFGCLQSSAFLFNARGLVSDREFIPAVRRVCCSLDKGQVCVSLLESDF